MTAETYSIRDLCIRLGVEPRTIRSWTTAGVLPGPALHGRNTRYTRHQLLIAHVIAHLREQRVRLDEIRRRVAGADDTRLLAMLPAPPYGVPAQPPPPPPEPTYPAARWERVALMPGLELHVDTQGGPVLRQIAQAIWEHYAVGRVTVPG